MLLMNWTHWFDGMMETRPSDRMYNCHSVDGAVTTGAVLVNGGSVVIPLGMGTPSIGSHESRTTQDCTSCEFLPY
jgi:hypothetical protein